MDPDLETRYSVEKEKQSGAAFCCSCVVLLFTTLMEALIDHWSVHTSLESDATIHSGHVGAEPTFLLYSSLICASLLPLAPVRAAYLSFLFFSCLVWNHVVVSRLVANYITFAVGEVLLLVLTVCSLAAIFPRVSPSQFTYVCT